jgi:hypothetical protein
MVVFKDPDEAQYIIHQVAVISVVKDICALFELII